MGKDYFFGKDDQRTGPFDQETVKKMVAEGQITSQTLAWCEGMDNWIPAGQVGELSSLFNSSPHPPPLPSGQATPPPLPGSENPEGLSPWEQKAYQFATTIYRPWKGKDSPIGAYVRKNPKNAVGVSLGTIAVMALIVFLFISTLFSDKDQGQQTAQYQQDMPMGQMPPAGWQAQHRAVMDAQREIGQISHDAYIYRRDRQDKMDDLYRKTTYGTDD